MFVTKCFCTGVTDHNRSSLNEENAFKMEVKAGILINGLNDDNLRVLHLSGSWDFVLFHYIAHLLAVFSMLDENRCVGRFCVLEDHGGAPCRRHAV